LSAVDSAAVLVVEMDDMLDWLAVVLVAVRVDMLAAVSVVDSVAEWVADSVGA